MAHRLQSELPDPRRLAAPELPPRTPPTSARKERVFVSLLDGLGGQLHPDLTVKPEMLRQISDGVAMLLVESNAA